MTFANKVFINCPFDRGYRHLLQPLLFTIIYLRLKPRIALERFDSGESRVAKIIELISLSKYAIHDISRLKAYKAGETSRLNMPFELGIDVGCRIFGKGPLSQKRCLILEAERYRYQAALSDLAGSDIAAHNNRPDEAVVVIRNWLATQCCPNADGPAQIWNAFADFTAEHRDKLKRRAFSDKDVANLPIPELLNSMECWVANRN